MVCAGDHVDGYRVRVPLLVPEETPEPSDANALPVSEETARLFLERIQEWLERQTVRLIENYAA
jgi:hypothetical protein